MGSGMKNGSRLMKELWGPPKKNKAKKKKREKKRES
jgi:hypothetical protein